MRRSPHSSSRRRGFTLLEMMVAMTFVSLLASGIVLSISTALRVWRLTTKQNEVNQEARAILELLGRDLRGAYVGWQMNGGFFLGGDPSDTETAPGQAPLNSAPTAAAAPVDTLFLTTDSSSAREASFLPEEELQQWDQEQEAPVSDQLAVRWEWREAGTGDDPQPAGLYRLTYVIPTNEPESLLAAEQGAEPGLVRVELVSTAVKRLRFTYRGVNGEANSWDSRELRDPTQSNPRERALKGVPQQVKIELELNDPTQDATTGAAEVSNSSTGAEHTYTFHDVVTIATR